MHGGDAEPDAVSGLHLLANGGHDQGRDVIQGYDGIDVMRHQVVNAAVHVLDEIKAGRDQVEGRSHAIIQRFKKSTINFNRKKSILLFGFGDTWEGLLLEQVHLARESWLLGDDPVVAEREDHGHLGHVGRDAAVGATVLLLHVHHSEVEECCNKGQCFSCTVKVPIRRCSFYCYERRGRQKIV